MVIKVNYHVRFEFNEMHVDVFVMLRMFVFSHATSRLMCRVLS